MFPFSRNFSSVVICQACISMFYTDRRQSRIGSYVVSPDIYWFETIYGKRGGGVTGNTTYLGPNRLWHSKAKCKSILQASSSVSPSSWLELPVFDSYGHMLNVYGENGRATYFMKSSRDIQNTPSSDPWAMSSYLNSRVHRGDESDQSPVHEKRPQGLRRRTSLWRKKLHVQQWVTSNFILASQT